MRDAHKEQDEFIRSNLIRKGAIVEKDPVCGMMIDEKKAAGNSVYKGTTYYFCAKSCKEKFDKNPEHYLALK
jgi:YHS domain-containing protein